MIVGIDAVNTRGGGGVTHLVELLRAANPAAHGFSKVILWSSQATLAQVDDRPWLTKMTMPALNKGLPFRAAWQRFVLSGAARSAGCDVLLIFGGSYAGSFAPVVAQNSNLLPFDMRELLRFGWSARTLKFLALRATQTRAFQRSAGVIFLSEAAKDAVLRTIGGTKAATAIVPHGVDKRFAMPPRSQKPISAYSEATPFRLLYVSQVDMYKHQWRVVEAVAQLRAEGLPVTLELVGAAYPPALEILRATMHRVDPAGAFVKYVGGVMHTDLPARYAGADMCVFASTCETFGQIVTEAMSAGTPIACSNRSAMPEVLGDAGVYFDPEEPADIARALREMIASPELRARKAQMAFERAQTFTWARSAAQTFALLARIAGAHGAR